MQIVAVVLYHRDGARSHAIEFWPGRLNIVTGASETGKSALIEIVDYCLGSDRHGVYRSPELDTVGWYGLMLQIDDRPVFVARRAPDLGHKTSSDAMLLEGCVDVPPAAEIEQTTNIDSVTARLAELIGIDSPEMDVPEGSARPPIRASLRHALAYVFQRQRLIADPEYLFNGQERPFAAMATRDTLPYFLGAVDTDALQQRRELRARRQELKRAQEQLRRLTDRSEALAIREHAIFIQARDAGLMGETDQEPEDVRAALAGVVAHPPEASDEPLTGEAGAIADLDLRRREVLSALNEVRAERRSLLERQQLANRYTRELVEHQARLLTLGLLSDSKDADATVCPLCGARHETLDPSIEALRTELRAARTQSANSRAVEPRLDEAIARLDDVIATHRGTLKQIEEDRRQVVAASELAQQARSRREVQAFVRGRILAFLEDHPVADPAVIEPARETAGLLQTRVGQLERALSPEVTRLKTERYLETVGEEMTRMATELGLGYTEEGVRLDPVALTVVAGRPDDQLWLNEDIGSGKNWVGFHLVTLLALHEYFVTRDRPVPRVLFLDQPTQAFYPSERRRAGNRKLSELADEDQQLVKKQFALLRNTVALLKGRMQIIVTDHADEPEKWFASSVRHEWRDGAALVPSDWYS